jgi:hypothetical protein
MENFFPSAIKLASITFGIYLFLSYPSRLGIFDCKAVLLETAIFLFDPANQESLTRIINNHLIFKEQTVDLYYLSLSANFSK